MPNISKRDLINSCGIVVVRKENNEYKYLLLNSKGYFDFPKGRPEPNETKIQTALRETEEETLIKPNELNFKWGMVNKDTEIYGKGKFATYFIAETNKKEVARIVSA